ncbi:O-antigen ligase family protein [Sphingobacterium multivorum]|uniref:O-antigen ligase family protein n=1 Tax=Sphingobacterium multivorum TaxID=28454 RepID=UPI0031BBC7B3
MYTLFYRKKSIFAFIFLVIIQLFAVFLIFICFSRGTWISLLLSTIIFLIVRYRKTHRPIIKKVLVPFLILIIPIGIHLYNLKPVSANGRILIWKISSGIIKDNPLFGIGEGNFAYSFLNHQHEYFQSLENIKRYGSIISDIRFAFNDILHLLVEDGILGLSIFLLLLFIVTKMLYSIIKSSIDPKKRTFAFELLLMLCILILGGLTSYPLSLIPFKAIIVAIFALTVNTYLSTVSNNAISTLTKNKTLLLSTISILTSIILIFNVQRTYCALISWRDSVVYSDHLQLAKLRELTSVLSNDGYFLYYIGTRYLQNKDYVKAINYFKKAKLLYPHKDVYLQLANANIKMNDIRAAELEYKFLLSSFPNEIDFYSAIAHFYNESKEYKALEKIKERVQLLTPKGNAIPFERKRKEIINL